MNKKMLIIPAAVIAVAAVASWTIYSTSVEDRHTAAVDSVTPGENDKTINEDKIAKTEAEFYSAGEDYSERYCATEKYGDFYVNSKGLRISKDVYLKLLDLYTPDVIADYPNVSDLAAVEKGELANGSPTEDNDEFLSFDSGKTVNKKEYIKLINTLGDADAVNYLLNEEIAEAVNNAEKIDIYTDINDTEERTEKTQTITLDSSKVIKVVTYTYKTIPQDKGNIVIKADMKKPVSYKGIQLWDSKPVFYQDGLENYKAENGTVSLDQNIADEVKYSLKSVLVVYGED